jgi:hypothetical protein
MSFDLRDLQDIPDPLAGRAPPALPAPQLPDAPAPTRQAMRRRRILASVVSVVWVSAIVAFFGGVRGDLSPSPLILAHVFLPALFGGAALFTAMSGGPAGVGPAIRPTLILSLLAPITFVLTALCFPTEDARDHFLKAVFICGDIVLVMGAVPLAALAWSLRHACVSAAPWRSVLLAVAVGLTSAAAIGAHCSVTDGLHVALGHGLPILILGLVGWFLVRRVTKV